MPSTAPAAVEMNTPPKFELSDKAEITVDHGPYGNYVLFGKGGSKISLSPHSWKFLKSKKSVLCAHLVTDKLCEFKLNEKKKVKVSAFNEFMMVSFVEQNRKMDDGKFGDVHVNFTAKEWNEFMKRFDEIGEALKNFVCYLDSKTKKWSMIIPDDWSARTFHEQPHLRTIELLLAGYLLENAIYKHAKDTCRQCFDDVAVKHFYTHENGCGEKFEKMVERYFDLIWEKINMDDAFGKFSTFTKRFHFPPLNDDM